MQYDNLGFVKSQDMHWTTDTANTYAITPLHFEYDISGTPTRVWGPARADFEGQVYTADIESH